MIRRYLLITLALISLAAGLITLPTPLPTGIPLIALSLLLALNISRGAKVFYVRNKRRFIGNGLMGRFFIRVERKLRRKKTGL